ncbi:MAG TPA: alpha/beta hydrolase, partial [Armatimonadota bacterium]|nr:alpha/beta hydrolase [Armatimonadota bacterium]
AIGFDHRSWDLVAPHLADRYQVAALDLPGHGESEKPRFVDYGLWALGARVEKFLDELGWDEAVLVGNSLGGGTALSATLQAPERVRALALVNSVAFRKGLPHLGRLAFMPLAPVIGSLAPSLAVRVGLESVRSRWGSVTSSRCNACQAYMRSPEGREAFFQTLRQLYGPDLDEMAQRYSEVRCPTLVVHGDRDPLIRIGHAERLAHTLPHARLVRLPRLGHFPQEEAPEKVALELRKFLDAVTAPEAAALVR